MNIQPIEHRVNNGEMLEVHSIFSTIQGEGPFCGTPAVFIRLAGCNLQCPMCDTDYTSKRQLMSVEQIAKEVTARALDKGRTLVVITGGEPFRQNLSPLLDRLLMDLLFYIQIETNGTLPPPPGRPYSYDFTKRFGVYIVCSPKTGAINQRLLGAICAVKYVLSADSIDDSDGLPLLALGHPCLNRVGRVFTGIPIYVQPADSGDDLTNELNLQAAIDSCMKFNYYLQVQMHKIIGLP